MQAAPVIQTPEVVFLSFQPAGWRNFLNKHSILLGFSVK